MKTYNERSGAEFSARFTANNEQPVVPTTVHWRLDCKTTRQNVVDWTEVATTQELNDQSQVVAVTAVIEVPGSANVIQNPRNNRELKVLLVAADKDTDREYSEEHQYYVRNLEGRE